MPRVFVYEHVTAAGLGRDFGSPDHSLHVEGRAMRDAITADFAAVPGVEVLSFPDGLPEPDLLPTFRDLATRADWSFVIAPETGGELERLAREVIAVGGRLLGPTPDAIALTADKLRLAEHWGRCGVRTPRTASVTRGHTPDGRRIVKPRDGAGSEFTFLVTTPPEFDSALAQACGRMIVQEFVEGLSASVAFLIGANATLPLTPASQTLSSDGRFQYEGGELPLPPALADRAVRSASEAIRSVSGLFGYVGVDLILGAEADGTEDYAIEINPRLTTSYVGLRAAAETNLAGLLLSVVEGRPHPECIWRPTLVRWKPDGQILVAG
jgi:hypothetical protein